MNTVDTWFEPALINGKPVLRWNYELREWEQIMTYHHDPRTLPKDRRELH